MNDVPGASSGEDNTCFLSAHLGGCSPFERTRRLVFAPTCGPAAEGRLS